MDTRMLGRSGLEVSALGLGCMPMSSVYGSVDADRARATLELAVDLGVTFWDTAEIYGDGGNEELIAPVLARHRDRVVIATKFGFDPGGVVAGRPENARRAIEGSLRRLGTDVIDLWYLHRVDPSVPIEDTIGAMAESVAAGRVRHLGLSEASAESLRRASAVHPIAALQSEWSLWTRDLEPEVLPVARELGIGIVPYSPLGRGLFTGVLSSTADLDASDYRRTGPRFAEGAFEHNRLLVQQVEEVAQHLGCTPGQLALAWVLAQGPDVVPIPGTTRPEHLRENAAALDIRLTPADVVAVGHLMKDAEGARYARPHAYGDSPRQEEVPPVQPTDSHRSSNR
jgi:aryl-alcohol dehydrogenase-like predicted oxidoreductase